MAVLTVQNIGLDTELNPTYASAAGGGDSFVNSGAEFLHIKNGDASPMTVTIASNVNCNQGSDHDIAVIVPATDEAMVGPFPKARFDDAPATASVAITYSAVTSVTVGIIRQG